MYFKLALISFLIFLLSACGGGGSSDSDDENESTSGVAPCEILMNSIVLEDDESCELSPADADNYNLSSGIMTCSGGVIDFGNSQFFSSSGITLNGLVIVCNR